MNVESLYYFVEVAKELNVTSTAKRLFISQQCLSSNIQRLERHYGVKLFSRKPSFALTFAGEQLYAEATKILAIEENIKLKLNDIVESKCGCIKVGSTPIRSLVCIPEILPVFSKKYPDVKVVLTEFGSLQEEKRLLNGEIDLHIGLINQDNTELTSKKLLQNNLYFVVSNELLKEYIRDDISSFIKRSKDGLSMTDFKDMPFMFRPGHNRLTVLIKNCMAEVGMIPNICFESDTHEVLLGLCKKGMGVIVVTQMFVHHMLNNWSYITKNNLNIFPVYHKGNPLYIDIGVSYLKSRYLPKYTRDFLQITESVFENIQKIRLY